MATRTIFSLLVALLMGLVGRNLLFAQEKIDLGRVVTVISTPSLNRQFSQEEIDSSSAASLPEFLADNNCLVMGSGGTGSQTTVSIGGYAGATIKVYVDGVLANNPNTGEFDWNSLPLEAIASISFNHQPVLGQEEFAGTSISITTRSFSARKINLNFSSQSYETNPFDTNHFALTLQDTVAATALRFTAGGTIAANRYRLVDGKTQENNGYQAANALLGWNRFIGNHSLGGSHRLSYNRLQVPAQIEAEGVQTNLVTNHSIFADLDLPYGLSQIQFTYDLDSLKYQSTPSNSSSSGTSGASENTDNLFHSLALQANHSFLPATLGNSTLSPQVSLKGEGVLSDFSTESGQGASPSRLKFYPSAALSWQFGVLEVKPVAGYLLVWDKTEGEGKTIFHHNFSGAITVNFWECLSLSVSTQNTLPTFNQLYWNYAGLLSELAGAGSSAGSSGATSSGGGAGSSAGSSGGKLNDHGNPHLTAESGYSIRLAFANIFRQEEGQLQTVSRLLPLNLSLGFSYYQNKIRWVSGTYENLSYPTLHTTNSGATYYLDGTLYSGNTFALGQNWTLGYNFQVAVTRSFLLDEEYRGNQIMWVPLVLANLGLQAGYKDVNLQVGYDFTSKRYTSNYNTTYYSPIHLVSCRINWHYSPNLVFSLEGSNLLDQKYYYHDGYSGPSRSYTVKVKTTF